MRDNYTRERKIDSKVHPLACAKLETIAIRFPMHKVIRSILKNYTCIASRSRSVRIVSNACLSTYNCTSVTKIYYKMFTNQALIQLFKMLFVINTAF